MQIDLSKEDVTTLIVRKLYEAVAGLVDEYWMDGAYADDTRITEWVGNISERAAEIEDMCSLLQQATALANEFARQDRAERSFAHAVNALGGESPDAP